MRLTATQVKETLNQLDARVLPDDHPVIGELNELFGDHTFFIDESGLKVVEFSEMAEADMQTAEVVSLADWKDATFNSLMPHAPAPTGIVVVFNQSKH